MKIEENQLISEFNETYFKEIIKYLNRLKNKKLSCEYEIIEIIIIYFIIFQKKNLDCLFVRDIKKLILSVFENEKLIFLNDELLNEEIVQEFIMQIPSLEEILSILKKSENYISYLKNIDKNIEQIFNGINSLKSLKGVFNINFQVSQEDDVSKLIELQESLIQKQKQKKKYFISFIPIIEQYLDLYIKIII